MPFEGTWVDQSVKCPTLDFHSGHDLRIVRSCVGLHTEYGTCLRFSLSLSAPHELILSLSYSLKEEKKKCPFTGFVVWRLQVWALETDQTESGIALHLLYYVFSENVLSPFDMRQ